MKKKMFRKNAQGITNQYNKKIKTANFGRRFDTIVNKTNVI